MDKQEVARLLAYVGGGRNLARLLNMDFDRKGAPQVIANWKRRGMPPAVVLANYNALKNLQRQMARGRRRRSA
jgi:hypothetical protein